VTRFDQPVVLPAPLPAAPGLSSRGLTALITGVLAVVLGAVMFLLPTPYAIFGPGPATNVLGTIEVDGKDKPLLTVQGARSYPQAGRGALDMTTIEVFGGPGGQVSLFDALRSWLSPERAVVPEADVFPPGQSAEQVRDENAQEMSTSQENATAAGLREVGLKVPEKVSVASVDPKVPAASVLRAGDQVVRVAGQDATDSASVRSVIGARAPGDVLPVTVLRGGRSVQVSARTTSRDGRTVLGVSLRSGYDFPVKVSFASQDVGGPSAGMMFALGVYDLLTPGDLTGGQKVAGTGTIDGAGTVGPIGGIAQKMVGAKKAGARWFLAPADNCSEVLGHVPDGLRVVRTGRLHESRLAVQAIADGRGGSLSTCESGPTP
jgi:Lon-like protease